MTDTGPQSHANQSALDQPADRRRAERFPFSAIGQAVEAKSKATLKVRISDISYHGCYADCLNVFPVGTLIRLSVSHSGLQFDTDATIVYAQSGLGMGIMFGIVLQGMKPILERYIVEARGGAQAPTATVSDPQLVNSKDTETGFRAQQHRFNRLISLMTHKGLLTPSEAVELMEKLSGNR